MRNTVAGCLLAAALISPRPAEAQCVTDQHSYTTHAEKISINTDSSLHGAASDAAAMWNQCSGLPVMHANDNLDALPINVVFHWGASPRADGACAQAGLTTSWNTVVGGTITIWGSFRTSSRSIVHIQLGRPDRA